MQSLPRHSHRTPRDADRRPPAPESHSCLTIMEIGEEEALAWDEIVALRQTA